MTKKLYALFFGILLLASSWVNVDPGSRLLREKYQLDPKQIPFDFHEVIAALAPRAFFSNSPLQDSNFDVAECGKGWPLPFTTF